MSKKVLAILQARMGSHRLPGKVMLPLDGIPALAFMLRRLRRAKEIDQILVATSSAAADDEVATLAESLSFASYRGSEEDVLDRFHGAALDAGLADDDILVRVTGDCPFIDAGVVDEVVRAACDHESILYVSNIAPPTFPDGLDVEAVRFGALRVAWSEATSQYDREHVTPFIRADPSRFPAMNVRCTFGDLSDVRLTLDEPGDYDLLAALAIGLPPEAGLADLLDRLAFRPDLMSMAHRPRGIEGRTT